MNIGAEQIADLQRAMDKIKAATAGNFDGLSLPELASLAGYSQFHFHRMFRQHFGITTKKATADRQIEVAKELMRAGGKLDEIARLCGFSHQSHFTSTFGRSVKQTPGRWKRHYLHAQQMAQAA